MLHGYTIPGYSLTFNLVPHKGEVAAIFRSGDKLLELTAETDSYDTLRRAPTSNIEVHEATQIIDAPSDTVSFLRWKEWRKQGCPPDSQRPHGWSDFSFQRWDWRNLDWLGGREEEASEPSCPHDVPFERLAEISLHLAAKSNAKGNVEAIKRAIEKGASLEARDEQERTPLHVAAYAGQAEAVKALVEAGATLEAQDENELTPMHLAAMSSHVKAIKALVTAGASLEARGGSDYSMMTPLHVAAWHGRPEAIEALLQAGASLEARDKDKKTPLHLGFSAVSGSLEAIKALVKAGASLDARDKFGMAPLHLAASRGHMNATRALVDAGASLEAETNIPRMRFDLFRFFGGKTALELAADQSTRQILLDEAAVEKAAVEKSDREEEAKKASLRAFGESSGISALLSSSTLAEALPAAAAWFEKEGATTIDDVVHLNLIDDFVAALDLKRVPALRLAQNLRQMRDGKEEL
jgi:ankyrin repeat protein